VVLPVSFNCPLRYIQTKSIVRQPGKGGTAKLEGGEKKKCPNWGGGGGGERQGGACLIRSPGEYRGRSPSRSKKRRDEKNEKGAQGGNHRRSRSRGVPQALGALPEKKNIKGSGGRKHRGSIKRLQEEGGKKEDSVLEGTHKRKIGNKI